MEKISEALDGESGELTFSSHAESADYNQSHPTSGASLLELGGQLLLLKLLLLLHRQR